MAHGRQSRPDSGLGLQVKFVSFLPLGSEAVPFEGLPVMASSGAGSTNLCGEECFTFLDVSAL